MYNFPVKIRQSYNVYFPVIVREYMIKGSYCELSKKPVIPLW